MKYIAVVQINTNTQNEMKQKTKDKKNSPKLLKRKLNIITKQNIRLYLTGKDYSRAGLVVCS